MKLQVFLLLVAGLHAVKAEEDLDFDLDDDEQDEDMMRRLTGHDSPSSADDSTPAASNTKYSEAQSEAAATAMYSAAVTTAATNFNAMSTTQQATAFTGNMDAATKALVGDVEITSNITIPEASTGGKLLDVKVSNCPTTKAAQDGLKVAMGTTLGLIPTTISKELAPSVITLKSKTGTCTSATFDGRRLEEGSARQLADKVDLEFGMKSKDAAKAAMTAGVAPVPAGASVATAMLALCAIFAQ
jgi:hypothetical protein